MTAGPPASAGHRSDHSGIALILVCYAMLVAMDTIVKYLVENGVPVLQITWARFVFHFLGALPIFLFFHRDKMRARRPGLQLFRSSLLFPTTVLFFLALEAIPLASATAIAFAAPLILIAFSALFLKERVGPRRWMGVALGFGGILIIIRPGPAMELAYLLPLAAAVTYATYELTTRMSSRADHAMTTFFFTPIAGTLMSSAVVPFIWVSPSLEAWALMIVCGLLATGGHFLLILAFERSEASLIAPFGYSTIIWATLFGWIVFGHLPDGWTSIGAALIIASGLYIWYRERRVHRLPPTPTPRSMP